MSQKQRLRIAIGALTNVGSSYNFLQICAFARAASSSAGFRKSWGRVPDSITRSFVCSTLYQDAYNFAFQGDTIRLGARVTPAHLSASPEFEQNEPELSWISIV
jgi:hypothetical protein